MTDATSLLMFTGGGHHDFAGGTHALKAILQDASFRVETTQDKATLARLPQSNFAAVVFYTQGGTLTGEEEKGLLDFVASGRGFVGIHSAADSFKENAGYIKMLGSSFAGHGPQSESEIELKDGDHPISRHYKPFRLFTELYHLNADPTQFRTLLQAYWLGKFQPVAYVKPHGQGRVFYFSIGHSPRDFADANWQKIFVRGTRWAAGQAEKAAPRVGVIGYGGAFNMGRQHLNEMKNAGMVPVAACDVDPKRVEIAATDFPGLQTYTSTKDLLAKSDAELLVVILPHNLHAPVAVDVLNSGRHCVVEKPMTISNQDVDDMIAAARKAGKMLSAYHNRRWDGDYLALEDAVVHRKLIGDVFKIETGMGHFGYQGSWWRSSKDISGGLQYDWGAHILYWALGFIPGAKIKSVTAVSQKRVWNHITNEDHVDAFLQFDNGAVLDFEISTVAKCTRPKWRILGTQGAILDQWWVQKGFDLHTYRDGISTDQPARIPYWESQGHRYYQNVADHLRLGEPLEVTAEKAGRVIRVLAAMDEAHRTGRPAAVPGEQ